MYVDFSSLFHQSSKDLRDKGKVHIPQDEKAWPEEWSTVFYKTYPRTRKIRLVRGKPPPADFFSTIGSRHSSRAFTGKSVDIQQLSLLLEYAAGITHTLHDGTSARAYASGGARFPIEIYPLILKGSAEIPAGLYHYGVRAHELETLVQKELSKKEIDSLFVYPWVEHASFALFFTVVFSRTQHKYGERGYRYVLLEAGHVSENVYLCAEALGLGVCAMTGLVDTNIEHFLDIDGVTESVVHSLILGETSPTRASGIVQQ